MANEVVQLTDDTNNNIFPIAGGMASDSITTAMLQDGSVTSAKFAQYVVNNAIFAGKNLVPASDTVADWINLFGGTSGDYGAGEGGYWVNYYNEANKFTNQPAQYGWLETIIEGTNIYQRWTAHAAGPVYYRAGNATGWYSNVSASGAFRQIFDTVHNNITMTSTDPGEGATLEAGHFIAVYS